MLTFISPIKVQLAIKINLLDLLQKVRYHFKKSSNRL
jgi:hypothetical protein